VVLKKTTGKVRYEEVLAEGRVSVYERERPAIEEIVYVRLERVHGHADGPRTFTRALVIARDACKGRADRGATHPPESALSAVNCRRQNGSTTTERAPAGLDPSTMVAMLRWAVRCKRFTANGTHMGR